MTSAEGGMIITDDDHLASEARIYRDQGKASFLTEQSYPHGVQLAHVGAPRHHRSASFA